MASKEKNVASSENDQTELIKDKVVLNKKANECEERINKKKKVKVLKSLGNSEVMENLASYLSNQDLGSFYETCQTVKNSIDDLSLWRKRTLKLATFLGSEQIFVCKSEESVHYQEHCYRLHEIVESEAVMLRERINRQYTSLRTITDAARLAHHGMLGFIADIWLQDVDLASVPAEHLASLASCATRWVCIVNVDNFVESYIPRHTGGQ